MPGSAPAPPQAAGEPGPRDAADQIARRPRDPARQASRLIHRFRSLLQLQQRGQDRMRAITILHRGDMLGLLCAIVAAASA
ncbi:hypothetical protein [Nonomuraea sp. B5E05]|uniref:hypothetical protein n=1 Tax=Nonomuraea sp. B5E05 TaxID=3153569 RepID=UPI0032605F5C